MNYLDKMSNKKREMLKVVSYAFMVLLALAIYTIIELILKNFVVTSDLSFKQEVGARLAYPLVLLLILWNLKVFI